MGLKIDEFYTHQDSLSFMRDCKGVRSKGHIFSLKSTFHSPVHLPFHLVEGFFLEAPWILQGHLLPHPQLIVVQPRKRLCFLSLLSSSSSISKVQRNPNLQASWFQDSLLL